MQEKERRIKSEKESEITDEKMYRSGRICFNRAPEHRSGHDRLGG